MRKVILFLMMCISLESYAQKKVEDCRIYVVLSYSAGIDNEDFTINIDDGNTIDYYRDENGKKAHFKTPAAALTYFKSLSWELVTLNTDNISPLTYWVFKKPVSKEEYDKVVKNALKK